MRRRKVLVGMGALTAGGAAAFGTEAFTSVQAERSVDVTVAGDQSAFVAIQPMSSDNAGTYVSTEDDNTVELNLDGDSSGSGQGVNQDGITDFEDLFRVINQGSQTTSVYFEDDSDAVTFRVTRSTDTETAGSTGQSLEGADNSVELGVGEQVIVGLTVDTLNNDVSGDLLDDVTLWAESGAAAPEQSIPQPQYVVDGEGADPNTFTDLSSALGSSDVSSGSVIGIEATSPISESSQISVDNSVTIVGVGGTSTIDSSYSDDGGAIEINADGVTLRNFTLEYEGQAPSEEEETATNGIQAVEQSDLTIDGLTVDNTNELSANPAINAEKSNSLTITNNTITDGNIGISHNDSSSETITVSGNYVNANSGDGNTVPEGIFLGYEASGSADISNKQFEIKNNLIENSASESADIKVGPSNRSGNLAGGVNGQTGKQAQLESLLTENDISRAQVNDGTASDGTLVTESLSAFSSLQDAVDTAASERGLTLVENGDYDVSVGITSKDFTLKGPNAGTPVEKWGPENEQAVVNGQVDLGAEGVTVNGMTVSPGTDTFDSTPAAAIYCTASDSTIQYNRVADFTIDIKNIDASSIQAIQVFESSRIENIKVKNNVIDSISYQGDSDGEDFGDDYGNLYGIHVQGAIGDTGDGNGVSVRGNTVSNLFSAGYVLGTAVSETDSGPGTPKNVTVTSNEFTNFENEQSIPGVAFNIGADAAEAVLDENSIRTPRGVEHKGSGTLDATNNYWGAPGGPSGGYTDPDGSTADGAGARIDITGAADDSAEVDFSPFRSSDI